MQALDDAESQVGEKVVAMAATSTGDFLRQLLGKLSGLSSLDLDSAEQLLRICVRWVESELAKKSNFEVRCLSF